MGRSLGTAIETAQRRSFPARGAVRDLTDPAHGPHVLQILVDDIVGSLRDRIYEALHEGRLA